MNKFINKYKKYINKGIKSNFKEMRMKKFLKSGAVAYQYCVFI